ncbi:MAG: S8 family serine peptidase [Candidatus Zixiibacteriota bacterium]
MLKRVIRSLACGAVYCLFVPGIASAMVIAGLPAHPAQVERIPGVLVVNLEPGVKPNDLKAHPTGAVMGIPGVDELNLKFDLQNYRALFPGAQPTKAPHNAPDLSGWYVLEFDESVDLDRAAAEYQSDPRVAKVEYDFYAYIMRSPNDPQFSQQWDLQQFNDHDIDATEAWDNTVGGGVILADTDTGVQWNHEDLYDNIWVNPGEDLDSDGVVMDASDINGIDDDGNGYVDDLIGWDFVSGGSAVWPGEDGSVQDNDPKDFNGHGTHTSGTIAAVTNNGKGVAGIAGGFGPATEPGCKIMCLRMGYSFNDGGVENGRTHMDYVAQAFRYAADNGAVAINYSFGSSSGGGIEAATDYAVAHGLVISAAAGNENSQSLGYLQSRNDVLCVASTNQGDQKSSFSNYSPLVDVSAPGSSIRSTVSNHYSPSYATYGGTSMAAPHVVGLVGLIRTLNPLLTRQEAFDIIINTADDIDALNPGYAGLLGSGRINAANAVANLASTNFDAAPLIGEAPLTVQFNDSSKTPATGWTWDFGDGDSAFTQNPVHVYGGGLYEVSLRTQTVIGQGFKIKTNYVTALAETVVTANASVPAGPGQAVMVELSATNFQPVTELIFPFIATNIPATANIDSVVTSGCRTSYFEYFHFDYDNRFNGQMAVRLRADNGGGSAPLPPGSGPILRLWMTTVPGADPDLPVVIDTATLLGTYAFQFQSPVLSYQPVFYPGSLSIDVARGDLNYDGLLNVTDVVAEVGIVFRGNPLPPRAFLVDTNCDGQYSLQDVIRLIEHVFRGGTAPVCP